MTLDDIEVHSKFAKDTAHLFVKNSPKYKSKFRDR